MALRLLVLRITERCNLACRYCYAAGSGCKKQDMDLDTASKAIELACPDGVSLRVQITGGEPLLNLDLAEELKDFGKRTGRRLSLSLQTNATLIDAAMAQRIKALGCGVGVSIDGIGASNGLRTFADGSVSFTAASEGIKALAAEGVPCNITAVVSSANASKLGELADLALYFGNIRGIGLDVFRPLGRGAKEDFSPKKEELEKGIDSLIKRQKELEALGVRLALREAERIKKRLKALCSGVYCYAQTAESLCVDPDGRLWPCASLTGTEGMQLGSLQEGFPKEPLPNGNGPEISERRLALAAPESCTSCKDYKTCLGGCPAGRLNGKNDITCAMHGAFCERIRL